MNLSESNIHFISYRSQTYSWGKKAAESLVFKLSKNASSRFDTQDFQAIRKEKNLNNSYAELWMGTHPNGPSSVILYEEDEGNHNENQCNSGQMLPNSTLSTYLKGKKIYNGELPFLLKILSVNQALSIQAHPNKDLAKILHANDPEHYKDPNHKPEMTIALTDFEMLCGFKKYIHLPEEITNELNIDTPIIENEQLLRQVFAKLMQATEEKVTRILKALISRISSQESNSEEEILVLRLHSQYGNDVGVLCPYVMNYIKLAPGESVFLAPNEPHSYLFGDCVECMACSDNVVRAGLTPKFRDVETLINMLTYRMGNFGHLLSGIPTKHDYLSEYKPPSEVTEFKILKLAMSSKEETKFTLDDVSLGIVIEGDLEITVSSSHNDNRSISSKDNMPHLLNSLHVRSGDSFIIDPQSTVLAQALSEEDVLVFIATPQEV